MILTLLSPLIGIVGSLLPRVLQFFEKKAELQHQIELTKIQIEAAKTQGAIQIDIENIKADAIEGKSLRDHDSSITGNSFMESLRASVRPVITYLFFALFAGVKITAVFLMAANGAPIPEIMLVVWDEATAALFATIMAFWFGSRIIDRMSAKDTGTRVTLSTPSKTK